MQIREAGQGPLVLLCHGFPEMSLAWRHQLPALAEAGYRAVAPDLRGVGGTDAPADIRSYSVIDLVGDAVALLDALGEEQGVIVGNDWGANLAWHAALLRPDRFRAVAALGVPMMGAPPVPPTTFFPQTEDALFYLLWFQEPGVAEAELEADPYDTLLRIYHAASGEAGPRRPGDGTPNPFGMVPRQGGFLTPLPRPASLPAFLSEGDLESMAAAYRASGFRGGLNLYRNLDRNAELMRAFAGRRVEVPALFAIASRDTGLAIPGMRDIIAAISDLVPDLRASLEIEGSGHWMPQEAPDEVNAALIRFLSELEPS
jgi:pimeloyl-ACP methyl ester carboxylesterase